MRKSFLIIFFFLFSISIFAKDVSILYPTSKDLVTPGAPINILINNPLGYPVNLYYRFDNDDWELLVENYKLEEFDWFVPLTKSSNIYFKIESINYEQPQLYWHEEAVSIAEVRSGIFTPSGKYIVTSAADRYVKLWDFNKRILSKQVNLSNYGKVNFSSPMNDSITAVAVDTILTIINFSKANPIEKAIGLNSVSLGVDCTELNGGMIAVTTSDSIVYVLNKNGELIRTFKSIYEKVLYSVRFSKDAKLICFAGYNGYIECYDFNSGDLLVGIKAHGDDNHINSVIWSIDISPDNKRILSGGTDRKARVWSIETGVELANYESHNSHIRSVRFSPDGNLMISGSLDNTFRQYNAINLKEFSSVVINHNSPILSVDYSPDSKYIISSGRGNDFKVWRNFTYDEMLDSVQSSLKRKFSIYIPHLVAKLNDKFQIPVLSNYNKSEVIFDKDEYDIKLSIEFPVLLVDLPDFDIKPNRKLDTLEFSAKFYPEKDTILLIDALTLLGAEKYGAIRILNVESEGNLEILTEDGSITIIDDCIGDSERNLVLMDIEPKIDISPNPANDYINIKVGILEDDNYELIIRDIDSKIIMRKNLSYLKSGDYNFDLSTKNLTTGIYNLTITNKRFIFKSILMINK